MPATRKMHLVAYLKTGPTASYASAWRHPSAPLHDIWDAERYEHLARLLEHARTDVDPAQPARPPPHPASRIVAARTPMRGALGRHDLLHHGHEGRRNRV